MPGTTPEDIERDVMKAMFERSQQNSHSEMQFTPEESEKFKKAFDDPEFRKMFAEYLEEMQNPKYREETEMYISQLEKDNEVPEGKELIRPLPFFVAKTYKTTQSGSRDKVFVNVVYSDKIMPPSKTATPEGENWSLPYSLGPPHMEKDSKGSNAAAFDCCFHTDAFKHANNMKKFKDLLVQTAIEGISEYYRRTKQEVTMDKEFHVLKGIDYKQGQVPSMLIATASKGQWKEESNGAKPTTASDKAATKPNLSNSGAKSEPAIKKGFLNKSPAAVAGDKSTSASKQQMEDIKKLIQEVNPSTATAAKNTASKANAASGSSSATVSSGQTSSSASAKPSMTQSPLLTETKTEYKKSSAVVDSHSAPAASGEPTKIPKYTLKERGNISMGDFESMKKNKVLSNRPAELIYKLELPLVTKPSAMTLDVAERSLKFSYLDDYELTIALPYPVFDKKGTAKFDKTAKTLTLTLPVRPHEEAEQPPAIGAKDAVEPANKATASVDRVPTINKETFNATESNCDSSSNNDSNSNSTSSNSNKATSAHAKAATVVKSFEETEEYKESQRLREAIQKQAEEAQQLYAEEAAKAAKAAAALAAAAPPAAAANPNPSNPPTAAVASAVPSSTTASAAVAVDKKDFYESMTFQGARPGYFFGRGAKGLGYYLDPRYQHLNKQQQQPQQSAAKATSESPPVAVSVTAEATDASKAFTFEYRQTTAAIAVLVQVPGIAPQTVRVRFTSSSCDIAFRTVRDPNQPPNDSSSSGTAVDYALGLDVSAGPRLEVKECRYDVAAQNMVVVLTKQAAFATLWSESDASPLLTVRKYRDDAAVTQPSATTAAATATGTTASGTTATAVGCSNTSASGVTNSTAAALVAPPSPLLAQKEIVDSLNALKFSTSALFDLD